jgi:TolB-like protein
VTDSGVDVFVSYKAEDRARLAPVVAALEAEGFSVWWDAHIGGGTNWHEDIEEHLESARCVVVAWSKRSAGHDGNFVREEARRAQRRGVYLPIRIDATEPPLGFGEIQAISLKGWHEDPSDARFVALVEAIQERVTGEHVAHHPTHYGRPVISRRTAVTGGIGIGTVALAAAGGWLLLKPAPANAKRIAVLPFADLSPAHDQAYFSEGVAEELRAALTRIGLQVIGRNSCDAAKDLDIKTAATKLDVAHVLTGSVRRSPATIRVNAQLVGGKDGVERWAQTYDRAPGDVITIQTDIAAKVAEALSIALGQAGRAALTLGGTTDSAAQDLMLRARKLRRDVTSAESYREALALVDAAIVRDPKYAEAHVERAFVLNTWAGQFGDDPDEVASQRALATQSANRALAIAPSLGSAHAVLAYIEQGRLNFAASLKHLEQALALSPNDPEVLSAATNNFEWLGRGQEALRLADQFVSLDPLNNSSHRRKAQVLHALRQFPQSVEAGRKASELAPKASRVWAGNSMVMMGRYREAVTAFEAMAPDDPFRLTGEALVAARTGDRTGAERMVDQMYEKLGITIGYQAAQVHAQLGQNDRAFADLDNALAARDGGLMYLKMDPLLDPIRGDPRYAALASKLHFP